MNKTKVLFFGTDEIALSAIKALSSNEQYQIVGIVTRADKAQGRKQQVVFSLVKNFALANNYKLFQPTKYTDEVIKDILATKPDVILTCSYGKIIPEAIINFPKYKSINIHPSLLPKYRGASPIQAAVMNNETQSGISFIYMTNELDNGDILVQEKITLEANETSSSLREKVALLIPEMINKYFHTFIKNEVKTTKQNEALATYVGVIKRTDEMINWHQNAIKIDAFVRALMNDPIAYSVINNTNIKILETVVSDINANNQTPGTIINLNKDGIYVNTLDRVLIIKKIQLPGKKPMLVSDFINGNRLIKISDIFIKKN